MQDWLDSPADEIVAYGLQSIAVTSQQKRAAWEALRARAEQQPMLPPLDARPAAHYQNRTLHTKRAWHRNAMQWVVSLMLDDTRYDRALNLRHRQCLLRFYDNRSAIWSAA